MKKITLIFLLFCSIVFGQDLGNPAIIGQTNRNQKVGKGFQIEDTLLTKGKIVFSGLVTYGSTDTILGVKNGIVVRTLPSGGGGGGVPEAPNDGQKYGRQNSNWSVITDGGGGGSSLITTNRQPTDYTLTLTDANKLVEMNVPIINSLKIPSNAEVAIPIGTKIMLSQYGRGQTTVIANSGVIIRSDSSKNKISSQYSLANLLKIGSNEWYLYGNISKTDSIILSQNIISKMAHWYSASSLSALTDGTAIDSIIDLSGNNRTGLATSTTRPLYKTNIINGSPAIKFDGTNDALDIPTYPFRQVIFVCNSLSGVNFPDYTGFYGSRTTVNTLYMNTLPGTANIDVGMKPNPSELLIDNYPKTLFAPLSRFKIVSTKVSTTYNDGNGYHFGSDRKAAGRFLDGYATEIMGFTTPLTKLENDTVFVYLSQKYGLQLPVLYGQDGNSIGNANWTIKLRDTIGICELADKSVGSRNTDDRTADAIAVDTLLLNTFQYRNKFMIFTEGTNQLLTDNADTCYAKLIRYANARIAKGWKIGLTTVPSRKLSDVRIGYEADRVALNALLLATPNTESLKILNISNPLITAPGAYLDTNYFPDGIHPSTDIASRLIMLDIFPQLSDFLK